MALVDREEKRLIAGDSITVDGVTFVAVQAFTVRVPKAPKGWEWKEVMLMPRTWFF